MIEIIVAIVLSLVLVGCMVMTFCAWVSVDMTGEKRHRQVLSVLAALTFAMAVLLVFAVHLL